MDELQNKLFSLPDWGYVIYRTTYTAESDTAFPHAIRYIEDCLKNEFFRDVTEDSRYMNDNLSPADVWSRYQSTIIEDPIQFDGASLETVRAHFETWVDGQEMRDRFNKYRMCLIIDDEALQTLKDAPAANVEKATDEPRFVKVLEAFPSMDSDSLDEYPGWMKCWTRVLWFLWQNMGDGDEMSGLYEMIDDDSPGLEGIFAG